MAWTAPSTAIAGGVVKAADFNTFVRDNLNVSEAALALNISGFFVATGANAVAERIFTTDTLDALETTASTTYTNLATVGPTVSVVTGTAAVVIQGCRAGDNTNTAGNPSNKMSWSITGATTRSATTVVGGSVQGDFWAAGLVQLVGAQRAIYTSRWYLADSLTPGTNVFTAKYAVSSGTGSFDHRSLHVLPL